MKYLIKKTIPAQLEIVYLVEASSEEEALKNIVDGEEVYYDHVSHDFDSATIEVADQNYSWLIEKD